MTFKKHLAFIFAIIFICLSGCSNEVQTIIATQSESAIQDMSEFNSSAKIGEESTASNVV